MAKTIEFWKEKLTDIIARTLINFLIIIICGIPIWIILAAKHLLEAEGFWQNLVVYGLGFYFLGSIQLFLLIVASVLMYSLWHDD